MGAIQPASGVAILLIGTGLTEKVRGDVLDGSPRSGAELLEVLDHGLRQLQLNPLGQSGSIQAPGVFHCRNNDTRFDMLAS